MQRRGFLKSTSTVALASAFELRDYLVAEAGWPRSVTDTSLSGH